MTQANDAGRLLAHNVFFSLHDRSEAAHGCSFRRAAPTWPRTPASSSSPAASWPPISAAT